MKSLLKDDATREQIRLRAGLPSSFDLARLDFDVLDTAEVAVSLLRKARTSQDGTGASRVRLPRAAKEAKVGLKVPCHNTKAATAAQLELLRMYYTGVAAYDRCCGLSGTGRLKHPRIGTKIAEKLFEQIGEAAPQIVVSGCPSCRDGVKMQRDIVQARGTDEADFEIAGLFEAIVRDAREAGVPLAR